MRKEIKINWIVKGLVFFFYVKKDVESIKMMIKDKKIMNFLYVMEFIVISFVML